MAFSTNTKVSHGWRCVKCVTSRPQSYQYRTDYKDKFFRTYDQVDDFLVRMICSIVRNEPYDKMDAYLIKKVKQVLGVVDDG